MGYVFARFRLRTVCAALFDLQYVFFRRKLATLLLNMTKILVVLDWS